MSESVAVRLKRVAKTAFPFCYMCFGKRLTQIISDVLRLKHI